MVIALMPPKYIPFVSIIFSFELLISLSLSQGLALMWHNQCL